MLPLSANDCHCAQVFAATLGARFMKTPVSALAHNVVFLQQAIGGPSASMSMAPRAQPPSTALGAEFLSAQAIGGQGTMSQHAAALAAQSCWRSPLGPRPCPKRPLDGYSQQVHSLNCPSLRTPCDQLNLISSEATHAFDINSCQCLCYRASVTT